MSAIAATQIRTDTITLKFHEDEVGGSWSAGGLMLSSYIDITPARYTDELNRSTYYPCGRHPGMEAEKQARLIAYGYYSRITGIDPETGRAVA
jgi:hypothetical protein